MDDPVTLFLDAREQARAAGAPMDATVAVLATATVDARPAARFVLVKDVDQSGFYFFSNYQSRKARELDANPFAALAIHWVETGVQFRVEGPVLRASAERSDAYFASRPRESQLGAWASAQSRPLHSRQELVSSLRSFEERFRAGPVPRPMHWGGYCLRAARIEHWVNGDHRLHERHLYERTPGGWQCTRLAP